MGRPRKNPIVEKVDKKDPYTPEQGIPSKTEPNEIDYMIYEQSSKWIEAMYRTGTTPNKAAILEIVQNAKYMVEVIING